MSSVSEQSEKQSLLDDVRIEVEKLLATQHLSEEEKLAILRSALSVVEALEG